MNDNLYRALKVRAAETNATVSSLVEEAIKYQIMEDLEDLEALKERENEPTLKFDDFVKELKADGLL